MKIKLLIIVITFFVSLINISYSADGGGAETPTKSNYDKGAYIIKKAKRLEKKGKIEKATIQYEKALKYLLKSNKEKPNKADTLNYLGFASRKLGNYEEAEKYYLDGLKIKPNHNGINEYLGELYITTNRIELAKERLNVLKDCKCEEYTELKELLDNY